MPCRPPAYHCHTALRRSRRELSSSLMQGWPLLSRFIHLTTPTHPSTHATCTPCLYWPLQVFQFTVVGKCSKPHVWWGMLRVKKSLQYYLPQSLPHIDGLMLACAEHVAQMCSIERGIVGPWGCFWKFLSLFESLPLMREAHYHKWTHTHCCWFDASHGHHEGFGWQDRCHFIEKHLSHYVAWQTLLSLIECRALFSSFSRHRLTFTSLDYFHLKVWAAMLIYRTTHYHHADVFFLREVILFIALQKSSYTAFFIFLFFRWWFDRHISLEAVPKRSAYFPSRLQVSL